LKINIPTLFIYLLCIQSSILFSQTSPVRWINNSYTINIDTTSNQKIDYYTFSNSSISNYAKYSFKNISGHVIFIDSSAFTNKFITKPNDTTFVSLPYSNFHFNFDEAFRRKRDTMTTLLLPFYDEGKIIREKVSCNITFGISKLIEYSKLQMDVTDEVTLFVSSDTINEYPSLRLKYFFTIKNISNKTILCTKELIAWNDVPSLRNQKGYVIVLPGESYKIPVHLNMDRKYRFKSQGTIEVLSDNISEVYPCEIVSKFERK